MGFNVLFSKKLIKNHFLSCQNLDSFTMYRIFLDTVVERIKLYLQYSNSKTFSSSKDKGELSQFVSIISDIKSHHF